MISVASFVASGEGTVKLGFNGPGGGAMEFCDLERESVRPYFQFGPCSAPDTGVEELPAASFTGVMCTNDVLESDPC